MRNVFVIFDLDGTLIDSYEGIKAALEASLSAVGSTMAEPLDRWIVGPPLDDLLRRAMGNAIPTMLAKAREVFVDTYDRDACKRAEPFPGVHEMLEQLRIRGVELGLATNKRLRPTTAILESRGWQAMFTAVDAIDSKPGPTRTKTHMLKDMLFRRAASLNSAVYIGDTEADLLAARNADITFIHAAWDGPKPIGTEAAAVALSPGDVLRFVSDGPQTHSCAG